MGYLIHKDVYNKRSLPLNIREPAGLHFVGKMMVLQHRRRDLLWLNYYFHLYLENVFDSASQDNAVVQDKQNYGVYTLPDLSHLNLVRP